MIQRPVLILLAGGPLTPMWPLQKRAMLRFGAVSLLVSQLQRFHNLGLSRAVVVVNEHAGNEAAAAIANNPIASQMDIQVVVQPENSGSGQALLQTAVLFEDAPDTPVYVVRVQDVVNNSLHEAMLREFAQRNEPVMAGYEAREYVIGDEYLGISPERRVLTIFYNPDPSRLPSNLINLPAHIHTQVGRLLDAVRAAASADVVAGRDFYELALNQLFREQVYRVVPYKGYWSTLRFPWQVLDVMKYFLAQLDGQVIGDGVSIAPNATLIGNIYIGPKATIFPGVTISGPAYIGAGTTVGHNALVRDSMILNDCEIGFSTEVTRTYASDRCVLNGSNILDSVMAEGAVISNGSVTSNRPIDGSEVLVMLQGRRIRSGRGQIGTMIGPKAFLSSNVVTIPGVKVGAGAQVGPGMYVHEDVEDGQRILVKQEVQVVDDGE